MKRIRCETCGKTVDIYPNERLEECKGNRRHTVVSLSGTVYDIGLRVDGKVFVVKTPNRE